MTDIATLSADVSTASALVTPFGAHLLSWRPTGHPDVLWLSSRAVLDGTKAIRGGIPLCLPWFGSPTDSPTRPGQGAGAHGFARTSPWMLLGSTQPANDAPASFSFELHHTGETSALYPHSFCARLDITAGAELNVTLTLTNEDDHPFAIEAALHTYLHVGDVKDVTLEGLDGERYYDKVRERATPPRPATSRSSGRPTASTPPPSRSRSSTRSWAGASSWTRTVRARRSCGTPGHRARPR